MAKHLLGPGIWSEDDGSLHISLPEFLAALGWPDDDAHRAQAMDVIREVFTAQAPHASIEEVD